MTQKNQQRSCTRRESFIPTQQNTNQTIIMTRKTNGVTFVQYVDDYSDSARRTDTSHSVSCPHERRTTSFIRTFILSIHLLQQSSLFLTIREMLLMMKVLERRSEDSLHTWHDSKHEENATLHSSANLRHADHHVTDA